MWNYLHLVSHVISSIRDRIHPYSMTHAKFISVSAISVPKSRYRYQQPRVSIWRMDESFMSLLHKSVPDNQEVPGRNFMEASTAMVIKTAVQHKTLCILAGSED